MRVNFRAEPRPMHGGKNPLQIYLGLVGVKQEVAVLLDVGPDGYVDYNELRRCLETIFHKANTIINETEINNGR